MSERELMTGYVVVGQQPGDNALSAVVEHSFAMDASKTHAQLYWSGTAYGPFGFVTELDGQKDAEEQVKAFNRSRPGWNFRAYHIEDEDCPIVLDLEAHRLATSKFGRRNPSFTMKE